MKHLEKGRSQRLAGKRKSNKPSKTRPSSLRQQQVAQRKRKNRANALKREHTAAKRDAAAIAHGEKPATEVVQA